ncbi:MAG TPA: carbohydrate-binding protein [Mucilaginibacter sp.]|jgi:hypothetical protein|nr:carbohydrate-binding protein [Mucilaginibacter sp.]
MKNAYPLFVVLFLFSCLAPQKLVNIGKPWQNKAQQIPGRVECEFYNLGGEGIAYHDSDSSNNGSGELNPANGTYLNEFRMHEGVDISFTKSHDIDNNHYSKVAPQMDQLYVGWTVPGEWLNYTVNIKRTGTYIAGLMYTANGDGVISLDLDGKDISGPIKVPSTHDDRDTVKWRQWHHWNRVDSLATVKLPNGAHTLTLHVVANGNMNFDYIEFK